MLHSLCAATTGLWLMTGVTTARNECTNGNAAQAEQMIGRAHNWTSLSSVFERYPQCDDGALAEDYSDKVAILLSDRWAEISEFARRSQDDDRLEPFVLKHVDILMSPEQARKIIENASTRCPSDLAAFCKKLVSKALRPD
jgi:hypothetical protein